MRIRSLAATTVTFAGSLLLRTDLNAQQKAPAPHPHGPEIALAEVQRMIPGEGLEVSLFASEPMLVNPADIDIDAQGRVWVCEGANYRSSFQKWGILRAGGDRIVILEDSNHDGSADKQTIFYQDNTVNTALGICVLGNKVIVSSSPYVFVLTDMDGDSKADRRELLFEDTSKGDHDHCLHAFVFGPDGKLYFNFGNEVRELRRPRGGTLTLPLNGPIPTHESETVVDLAGNPVKGQGKPYRQGMVFRCNLDGSDVETLGWNFRNNYEVAVDSFGTLWQSDNDDDGNRGVRINYVMEFGNYGYTDEVTGAGWQQGWKTAQEKGAKEEERPFYHWHLYDPGVVPNVLQTGNGSPTGIAVYEAGIPPFRNQVIHCDAGPRVVRAYPVTASGAGYQATMADVLTSPDSWYRPSDVCVGPAGDLYISDWHDAGVGGHNMADRVLESMTGRIYQVAPKGRPQPAPQLDLQSASGAVAGLQSPNMATRYLAWTALHTMQGKAEQALAALWQPSTRNPRMRARALHLLARIDGKAAQYVEAALKDDDSDIRITGLRIARERKLDMIPYVKRLATSASAQVRRECALALRHNPSPDAPRLWTALARQHDGKDRWYLEALGIAMDRQENKFFEAWLAEVGDQWNTPAGRDIVWRSRSSKAPALLSRLIVDKNTPTKEKERYLRALDFIQGPEKDAALVEISTSALN
jgi:putative membrane-bound dehydrogenase-like protein